MNTVKVVLAKWIKVRAGVLVVLLAFLVGLMGVIAHQENQLEVLQGQLTHAQVVNKQQAQKASEPIKIEADGKVHTIKTNLFEIEVYNYDNANFDATITPRVGRLLGEQGPNAQGLELYNFSRGAKGITVIQ